MIFKQMSLQDVWEYIENDKSENRFVARVFFINSLETYYSFIEKLSDKADLTVRLSDERFCKGTDTVPDLKSLVAYLDDNKDKDILLPNVAEYLRIGEAVEKNGACLHSILNRHVHSKKRVWIPIFLAKGIFQTIVGTLDEERFGQAIIEIDDAPIDFSATVYSKVFAEQNGIVDAVGIRAWLELWDDRKIKSGMSFATRQIRQIAPTNGDYTLKVIVDPYEYLLDALVDSNPKLSKSLGTEAQWASLIPFIKPNCTMEEIIPRALNMRQFEPEILIGSWESLSTLDKWAFNLWYQLGLNKFSDYISFAVDQSATYDSLYQSLECSIIDCIGNAYFEGWLTQRYDILGRIRDYTPSHIFMSKIDKIEDIRSKLKILTGRTHEERAKLIELVSISLREGKSISDMKLILQEKYPDLFLYLNPSVHLSGEVQEYISCYKYNKIADIFSVQLSDEAGQIDCLQFETRGSLLFALKNSTSSPYFLWFDGLGIEWIDLLLEKVHSIDSTISVLKVDVGTAVLPTITKANMDKADPETISEKKIDDLDALSHIKDKSDCNYFSIVARQIELIGSFAKKVVETIKAHPDAEVVVTADHGMSRMAAKGFHATQGVNPPSKADIFNHGRYCLLPTADSAVIVTNTKKEGQVVAFRTHNHFAIPGYAPGEIHGGATPEEMLVPVIHFARLKQRAPKRKAIGYKISSKELYLDSNGLAILSVQTSEPANSLVVDIGGTIIDGTTSDGVSWTVKLPGLRPGNSYNLHIYPNNLSNQSIETIFIKRKGLSVDDDF